MDIKPCPFCGCCQVLVIEGSTFRWIAAECIECGAKCGEVRRDTMRERELPDFQIDDIDYQLALERWNDRKEAEGNGEGTTKF